MLLKMHPIHHSFSKCGICATSGMSTTIYGCVALIENQNMKKDRDFKKYIFANMQHCWQHYITHHCCQPV
jgi:hypothetical protein